MPEKNRSPIAKCLIVGLGACLGCMVLLMLDACSCTPQEDSQSPTGFSAGRPIEDEFRQSALVFELDGDSAQMWDVTIEDLVADADDDTILSVEFNPLHENTNVYFEEDISELPVTTSCENGEGADDNSESQSSVKEEGDALDQLDDEEIERLFSDNGDGQAYEGTASAREGGEYALSELDAVVVPEKTSVTVSDLREGQGASLILANETDQAKKLGECPVFSLTVTGAHAPAWMKSPAYQSLGLASPFADVSSKLGVPSEEEYGETALPPFAEYNVAGGSVSWTFDEDGNANCLMLSSAWSPVADPFETDDAAFFQELREASRIDGIGSLVEIEGVSFELGKDTLSTLTSQGFVLEDAGADESVSGNETFRVSRNGQTYFVDVIGAEDGTPVGDCVIWGAEYGRGTDDPNIVDDKPYSMRAGYLSSSDDHHRMAEAFGKPDSRAEECYSYYWTGGGHSQNAEVRYNAATGRQEAFSVRFAPEGEPAVPEE